MWIKHTTNKFNSILPVYLHLLATPILLEALTRSSHGIKVGIIKTGVPVGANCMILLSSVLSQYQHVTNGRTDRQTDRQTDMPTIAKLHSSIAKCNKNISTNRKHKFSCPVNNFAITSMFTSFCGLSVYSNSPVCSEKRDMLLCLVFHYSLLVMVYHYAISHHGRPARWTFVFWQPAYRFHMSFTFIVFHGKRTLLLLTDHTGLTCWSRDCSWKRQTSVEAVWENRWSSWW